MEQQSGKDGYDADLLYDLYCQFAEASRAAILRVTLSPESRRGIAEESPCMSKEEFQQSLGTMGEISRREFIRRIAVGYDAAREESSPELKARFGRLISCARDV